MVIYVDIINPGSTRAGLPNAGGGGSKSATVERIEYKLLSLTYKVLTTCEVTTTSQTFKQDLPSLHICITSSGTDLGFYKGGCPIHPKGAPEVERQRSNIFPAFYIFKYEAKTGDRQLDHVFSKTAPKQKGGCLQGDTPWIRH